MGGASGHPYAADQAGKTMTADDWASIEILATNAAAEAKAEGNEPAVLYYRRIAGKAALRWNAAREGRCIP